MQAHLLCNSTTSTPEEEEEEVSGKQTLRDHVKLGYKHITHGSQGAATRPHL